MYHPTDSIANTTVFVIPVVEQWLERERAQWVTYEDRSDDPEQYERTLYHEVTPRSLLSHKYIFHTYINIVTRLDLCIFMYVKVYSLC